MKNTPLRRAIRPFLYVLAVGMMVAFTIGTMAFGIPYLIAKYVMYVAGRRLAWYDDFEVVFNKYWWFCDNFTVNYTS